MQQGVQRSAAEPGASQPAAAPQDSEGGPRGRRRRINFAGRIEATRELVGYTSEDAARIEASSALISGHTGQMAEEIYRGLLARPETAVQFIDAAGAVDTTEVLMRRTAFEKWLRSVIVDPLDVRTADYLASVGHAHARRESAATRIKARYLLSTIGSVQAAFTRILAAAISDPAELGACISAWNKRLMIHLDMLLAVYGSTEGSAHWY